jgi:hypothetical protein
VDIFSVVCWLLVRVAHCVSELHHVEVTHVRFKSEVVWLAERTLGFSHYASLNHSAHSHVRAIHNRHFLEVPSFLINRECKAANLLSWMSLHVSVECRSLSTFRKWL